MAIEFKIKDVLFEEDGMSFLKLGEFAKKSKIGTKLFRLSKVKRIVDIWATLGYASGKPMNLRGKFECSKQGSDVHTGITSEIAEALKDMNLEIDDSKEITERFIDLSGVNFLNLKEPINGIEDLQLRLELFLDPSEGALVFLQYNPVGVHNPEDCHIQLITPNSTPGNKQDRFSLTYIIDYTFGRIPNIVDGVIDLSEKDTETNPVIKILTFKRTVSDFPTVASNANIKLKSKLVDVAQDGLHLYGASKYDLLKYNPKGEFVSVPQHEVQKHINTKLKTLLLIHGTFSTTNKSFQELLEPRMSNSTKGLLNHLLDEKIYDQVIAFDHPTASHSPEDNVKNLLTYLNNLVFEKQVDIITTSRGALVEHCLVADESIYRILEVGKVINFSPAHGSDILKVAKGIDHLLTVLQKSASKAAWGYVFLLAQFSVEVIRTQPGLQAMFPNSPELERIMDLNPKTVVRYKPMVCDVHPKLFKGVRKLFLVPVDGMMKIIFRDENDWVIGSTEQRRQLRGKNAEYADYYEYYCMHGKQFQKDYPLDLNFKKADVFAEIETFLRN